MRSLYYLVILLFLISCGQVDNKVDSNSTFTWDFSKQKKYVYTYFQSVENVINFGEDTPVQNSKIFGNGFLNIRVKENNLADLSLTDIELQMVEFDNSGIPIDTIKNQFPVSVVQNMRPDGNFENPNQDILFNILFPIPSIDLKVGETDTIPLQVPFNVDGSRLWSKGYNLLKFEDNETINDKKCAVLTGIINISKLEIPEELTGKYICSTTGNAKYYFDIENHCFINVVVEMQMHTLADSRTGGTLDFGSFSEMKSDNAFKVNLERIEE